MCIFQKSLKNCKLWNIQKRHIKPFSKTDNVIFFCFFFTFHFEISFKKIEKIETKKLYLIIFFVYYLTTNHVIYYNTLWLRRVDTEGGHWTLSAIPIIYMDNWKKSTFYCFVPYRGWGEGQRAVGAASQWWSNERMMVYFKLMM